MRLTSIEHDTYLVTRFSIPNERELRKGKTTAQTGFTRTINFRGDGSQVTFATDFPFKAPGLQWNGGPTMTSK